MAIVNVLKFDANAEVFAWKYPNSELSTWTQLIVNESQEAILFKNGQAADVFGPGRYVLTTDNIPILQKFINIPFGKKSPFSAEVWFINKVNSLDIKWGTTTPIQIQDPKYNVFIPVRTFGQFGIKIADSKKFMLKLVGTMKFFNRQTLTDYFKGFYVTKVKDSISTYLVKQKVSLLEINAYLNEISKELKAELSSILEEYGIELVAFNVNDINVPENDSSVVKLKAALAKRAEMDIIGYDYKQERTFNTLENAADNPGAGSLIGSGIGLGMGFGIGGAVGSQAKDLTRSLSTDKKSITCPKCGADISEDAKFCPSCGANPHGTPKHVCSKCSAEITGKTKFCMECGRKLDLCAKCGADIPDGADKCPECGAYKEKLCPDCGAKISAGAKFCPECGKVLTKTCAGCGAAVADGVKFCPECGAKIN